MNLSYTKRIIENNLRNSKSINEYLIAFRLMTAAVYDYLKSLGFDVLLEQKFSFRSADNLISILESFQNSLQKCLDNEAYNFECEHTQTTILDLSIEIDEAIKALNNIRLLKESTNDLQLKENLTFIENMYKNSINILIEAVKQMCRERGEVSLLNNKDLDHIL